LHDAKSGEANTAKVMIENEFKEDQLCIARYLLKPN
jgi:hypothetical protein